MRPLILAGLMFLTTSSIDAQRVEDRAGIAHLQPGQWASGTPAKPKPVNQSVAPQDPGRMFTGGLTGGLLIGVIGGYAGYHAGSDCDYCEIGCAVVGALLGEAIGVPIGVRQAGGKGSLGAQILLSGGVLAVGALAAPMTMGMSLLAAIPFQVGLVVKSARVADATRSEEPR